MHCQMRNSTAKRTKAEHDLPLSSQHRTTQHSSTAQSSSTGTAQHSIAYTPPQAHQLHVVVAHAQHSVRRLSHYSERLHNNILWQASQQPSAPPLCLLRPPPLAAAASRPNVTAVGPAAQVLRRAAAGGWVEMKPSQKHKWARHIRAGAHADLWG